MKLLKLSLIASFAIASSASVSSAATSIKDAIENAKVDGFIRARYTAQNGANSGGGKAYQIRSVIDVITGEVNGLSMTAGIYYNKGSGAPSANRTTNQDIWGGKGDALLANSNSEGQTFGIGNMFAKYMEANSKTEIKLGQMTLRTPYDDKTSDRGIGGSIKNSKIDGISIHATGYDTWMSDDLYLRIKGLNGDDG